MLSNRVNRTFRALIHNRRWVLPALRTVIPSARGMRFAETQFHHTGQDCPGLQNEQRNPLRDYFETHTQGPGIWKWNHYFEIYHRHFSKFIGSDVHVMEIGVYSGGSLEMWRRYFGDKCHVYGIDIEPACLAYKTDGIDVLIGDQSDRQFWSKVRKSVPRVDIIVDDGGHHPEHQIVTLEEMLPHVSAGGVYLCEDIHNAPNYFASYVAGLASQLNSSRALTFVDGVDSIHLYPFVALFEKTRQPRGPMKDEKRGTQWQPFL
jgi:Methyltransferase domain